MEQKTGSGRKAKTMVEKQLVVLAKKGLLTFDGENSKSEKEFIQKAIETNKHVLVFDSRTAADLLA